MATGDEVERARRDRAHARRRDGVEYKLRVIPGSGGQLELVEEEPRRLRLQEWTRLMLLGGS